MSTLGFNKTSLLSNELDNLCSIILCTGMNNPCCHMQGNTNNSMCSKHLMNECRLPRCVKLNMVIGVKKLITLLNTRYMYFFFHFELDFFQLPVSKQHCVCIALDLNHILRICSYILFEMNTLRLVLPLVLDNVKINDFSCMFAFSSILSILLQLDKMAYTDPATLVGCTFVSPRGVYSPVPMYFGTCFKIRIRVELSG
jgi:hypothetical protein